MKKIFQGRVVLGGSVTGEALVTHEGVNMLASFQKSLLKKAKKAICSDQNNQNLYKKILTDKIICLPYTVGSTTAGLVLEKIAQAELAPKALLFSRHIDSLTAAGIILSEIWGNKKIITIDCLGQGFLDFVKTGFHIYVDEKGEVIIEE